MNRFSDALALTILVAAAAGVAFYVGAVLIVAAGVEAWRR